MNTAKIKIPIWKLRLLQGFNLPGMILCFLVYVVAIVYRSFRNKETERYARALRDELFTVMPFISWAFWLAWVLYIVIKQIIQS